MKIGPGDKVWIKDRFGKVKAGKVVMRGPAGWVLNMGGKYGVPAIANEGNIVKIVNAKKPGPFLSWRDAPEEIKFDAKAWARAES